MTETIILFLIFAAIQLLSGTAALVFSNLDKLGSHTPSHLLETDPIVTGITLLVTESLLAFGLWWWYHRIEEPLRRKALKGEVSPFRFLRFSAPRQVLEKKVLPGWKTLLAIVATVGLALGLSTFIESLGKVYPALSPSDNGTIATFEAMKSNPLCLLLLCVVGPAVEELVFRAGILRSLYIKAFPAWLAVGISALLFALIHGNLAQGIPAFLIGLLFGWQYLRTGNLRICLPAHILNNTLAIVLLFYPITETLALSDWRMYTGMALSAGLLFVALSPDKQKV